MENTPRIKSLDYYQIVELVDALFVAAFIFLSYGICLMVPVDESSLKDVSEKSEVEEIPDTFIPRPTPSPGLVSAMQLQRKISMVDITYTTIEYEYIGYYFITAYSDKETYYSYTASGTEVHWSDSNFEPTTCAIDRNYHGFGELLAVDFGDEMKVYVTEDTGAFRGLWIDCYVETLDEVYSWPTGYYPVYSVTYVDVVALGVERTRLHEWFRDNFSNSIFTDRSYNRNVNRIPYKQCSD